MPVITISSNTGADFTGCTATMGKQNSPTTTYSTDSTFEAVSYASGDRTHGHITNTGLSNIPSGSTINDVTIRLRVNVVDGGNQTISCYRVLRNVVQSQMSWNNYSTGNAWTTAGGLGASDADTTASASELVVDLTSGYYEWTGADLIQDVQDIVDGTNSAYGWLLCRDPDTAYDARYTIFTSESGTDGNRPEIVVDYTEGGGATTGRLVSGSLVSGMLIRN